RLMLPYFSVSIIVITLKLLEGNSYVNHQVDAMSYIRMFYYPDAGYYLWFIWALWWIFVVVALFNSKLSRIILFVFSIILAYIPYKAPSMFCLYETQKMFVYFMLGVVTCEYADYIKIILEKSIWLAILPFFIGEFFYLFFPSFNSLGHIILPYLGIYAVVRFCQYEIKWCSNEFRFKVYAFAAYSYGIYLFHTIFERGSKVIILRLFSIEDAQGVTFIVVAFTAILSGIVFPMLLYRYVINRNVLLSFLFSGIKKG
ncbi:MAG: hypothetical protein NC453_30655, partial [Muribaculum sp.]|nr:hypothetical protein [Muribaculum sp.]